MAWNLTRSSPAFSRSEADTSCWVSRHCSVGSLGSSLVEAANRLNRSDLGDGARLACASARSSLANADARTTSTVNMKSLQLLSRVSSLMVRSFGRVRIFHSPLEICDELRKLHPAFLKDFLDVGGDDEVGERRAAIEAIENRLLDRADDAGVLQAGKPPVELTCRQDIGPVVVRAGLVTFDHVDRKRRSIAGGKPQRHADVRCPELCGGAKARHRRLGPCPRPQIEAVRFAGPGRRIEKAAQTANLVRAQHVDPIERANAASDVEQLLEGPVCRTHGVDH